MKFEPGKYYKTRDGRKACVMAFLDNPADPANEMVGYISTPDNLQVLYSWYRDGQYELDAKNDTDLISEWKEKRKEKRVKEKRVIEGWVNVYSNRSCVIWDTREISDIMARNERIACVPVRIEFEEGEGLE